MFYRLALSLTRPQKQLVFLIFDMTMVPIAFVTAVALHEGNGFTALSFAPFVLFTTALTCITGLASAHLGLHRIKLNSFETHGVVHTAVLAVIVALAGTTINLLIENVLAPQIFFIFGALLAVLGVTWRLALRQFVLWVYSAGHVRIRVLVYGAGQTGQQLVAALRTDDEVEPVAFVDDNPKLQSLTISGLPVFARSQIKDLITEKAIDRVVLAMPSISQPFQARIAISLRDLDCEVYALPSFAELVGQGELKKRAAPVALDSLLGRSRLEKELPGVTHAYSNRRILVTGAGGSIGSELCRQLIACRPESLILLDHSELALYNIHKELREISGNVKVIPVLGSVCDDQLVRQALLTHGVEVVLHAAAYKHLPMVEMNALAGLQNNVIGTKILADAARDADVERFILVSSDKAVRPTNVMGASKRLAELVVQDLATRSGNSQFSMVRFGNVLGSSGSVIPLFEEQIDRGGPVTLTHGAITRYFMTISEAARLVLLAGSFARGGDVFVLDMGDPVPIRKLARQMIEGAGFSVCDADNPHGDIEIKITGLRKGEKLHEELLISPDMLTTPHNKILRAQESYLSELEMANALRDLRHSLNTSDEDAARAVIARWVEAQKETKEAAEEA